MILLFAAICHAANPKKVYWTHLTRQAYDRVEPRLQRLQPGTPLRDSGLEWTLWKLKDRGQSPVVRGQSDGWIGFLSGGPAGTMGLGALTGVSEEHLHGMHVFGYLSQRTALVPRYIVITRARRCSEAEYETIDPKIPGGRGRVESGGEVLFYRDVTIEGVRPAKFVDPEVAGTSKQKVTRQDLKATLLDLASPEAFARTAPKIEALKTGCELIDAVAELGGRYTTPDFGKNYYLFLDGALGPWMGADSDYPQASIRDTGRYVVWPFGTLEGGEPQPRIALVFRNGALDTVLTEASSEAVAAYLAQR